MHGLRNCSNQHGPAWVYTRLSAFMYVVSLVVSLVLLRDASQKEQEHLRQFASLQVSSLTWQWSILWRMISRILQERGTWGITLNDLEWSIGCVRGAPGEQGWFQIRWTYQVCLRWAMMISNSFQWTVGLKYLNSKWRGLYNKKFQTCWWYFNKFIVALF